MFSLFLRQLHETGYLIDFFKLNWMRYVYKINNDQKGSKKAAKSKMAAKFKMAAENDVFVIFSTNIPMLGLFVYFWDGISFMTVFF